MLVGARAEGLAQLLSGTAPLGPEVRAWSAFLTYFILTYYY